MITVEVSPTTIVKKYEDYSFKLLVIHKLDIGF